MLREEVEDGIDALLTIVWGKSSEHVVTFAKYFLELPRVYKWLVLNPHLADELRPRIHKGTLRLTID